MIPLWYGPSLEDICKLEFDNEIEVDVSMPFERSSKCTQLKILGPNGQIQLGIPIKKHPKGSPISTIKIDYIQKWQNQHWRSLQTCYGRSPFFEYYRDELFPLFYASPEYLMDFSVPIFEWVCKQYFPVKKISVILAQIPGTLQAMDLLPMSYEQDKRSIESPETYTQVFGQEFVSGLSVWDALFCAGPNFRFRKTV